MADDYSYDMKSVKEDVEMARRLARHSFVPAQGIVENGDDAPFVQTEQSEEDYRLNGPRCLNPTPEIEKSMKLYLYDREIAKLQNMVNLGNGLSIAASFAAGSGVAILKYAQTRESMESLLYGFGVSLLSGGVVKLANYFLNERPTKTLKARRDKLSELEK